MSRTNNFPGLVPRSENSQQQLSNLGRGSGTNSPSFAHFLYPEVTTSPPASAPENLRGPLLSTGLQLLRPGWTSCWEEEETRSLPPSPSPHPPSSPVRSRPPSLFLLRGCRVAFAEASGERPAPVRAGNRSVGAVLLEPELRSGRRGSKAGAARSASEALVLDRAGSELRGGAERTTRRPGPHSSGESGSRSAEGSSAAASRGQRAECRAAWLGEGRRPARPQLGAHDSGQRSPAGRGS